MLVFFGLDQDSADERGAKLKALQAYFKETNPQALNMLSASDMAPSNTAHGKRLVVNSHGNVKTFAGMDAATFLAALQAKGFAEGSFNEVYLMACKVGAQDQTNTIAANFAKDLKRLLIGAGITTKLYAPRGTLRYTVHTETKLGQTFYVVDKMVIACPEADYPLDQGMLLVTG
jgi:hypothetical protein